MPRQVTFALAIDRLRALATARSVLHGLGSRWPSGLSGLVPGCADRSCRGALSGPRKQPWRRGRRGGRRSSWRSQRHSRPWRRGGGFGRSWRHLPCCGSAARPPPAAGLRADFGRRPVARGEARRSVRGLGPFLVLLKEFIAGSEAAGDLETERCVRAPLQAVRERNARHDRRRRQHGRRTERPSCPRRRLSLSTRPFRSPRRCADGPRTEALQEHKSAADASGLRTSPITLMIEPKIGFLD